jgi:hypothetical protein
MRVADRFLPQKYWTKRLQEDLSRPFDFAQGGEALEPQDAKHAKKDYYLFLRTLAPFAPLRETRFSDLFFIRKFQISLARPWFFY